MKYHAHIYLHGFRFDLYRLWSFCFLFMLMQSWKTFPTLSIIIITFSLCRRGIFCKQKLPRTYKTVHKVAQSTFKYSNPRLRKQCIFDCSLKLFFGLLLVHENSCCWKWMLIMHEFTWSIKHFSENKISGGLKKGLPNFVKTWMCV